MRSKKLNITQELISMAESANSARCMIAQAVRLQLGGTSVNVTAESVSYNLDGNRYTHPLPARAAVELKKFDEDKTSVRPFQFVLDGRLAFARPVKKRPLATKRGPTKQRRTPTASRSIRRFHELRVIEVAR
jgi:hypothetical protein